MRVSRRLKKWGLIGAVLAVAAGATAGVCQLDLMRRDRADREYALGWARQIASQVDGLAFEGKKRGESDPLNWAVGFLTQGIEPRTVRVIRWDAEPTSDKEGFVLKRGEGIFVYERILAPETRAGIQVRIMVPYAGFLGSRTRLQSDLSVLIFFAMLSAFLRRGALLRMRSRIVTESASVPESAEISEPSLVSVAIHASKSDIRPLVSAWLADSKRVLTDLGIHVRDVVRSAHDLAVASSKARARVSDLRSRLHAGIRDTRDARSSLKDLGHAIIETEVVALNLSLDASKVNGAAREKMMAAIERLHLDLKRVRKLRDHAEVAVGKVERQMEPWSTDADLAHHALEEVFGVTGGMDAQIRKTTETLIGQAHLVQELRKKTEAS